MQITYRRLAGTVLALSAAAFLPSIGCRQVLDIPEPVECGSDDACTTADRPCIAGECIDGYCAFSFREAGSVVDEAEADDCKSNVCDGNGEVVVGVDAADAPADATAGDCQAPACDEQGNVIDGPADDAPADETLGDCSRPGCDNGAVVAVNADDDMPTSGDAPGDCKSPGCSRGAVVDAPNDADVPEDTMAGNCMSPSCDSGAVVEVVNELDTPAVDIDGDCLAPTCDAGGMQAVDDTDLPTSGCGSCSNGVVVPWPEEGQACYTGPVGTQNVGICVGGTFACNNNVQECAGEQTPLNESCGGPASGVNEDCDGQTDEEGPGCNCMLGQTQACYTGPSGTQDVGICVAGVSTCMATMSGNQYGACVGDVVPQTCDSCVQSGDQDCSGSAAVCDGGHIWSKGYGNTGFDNGNDVQQLPNGDVLFVGSFSGSLTIGNSVTSDGSDDALLARFDAAGNAFNVKDFGGIAGDYADGITLLDDGYVIFGYLGDGSSETFGSGATLTSVGGDGFIAKFNFSHTLQWKKLIGGTMTDRIRAVVRMPDNGIAVTGQFAGTLNVGGSNLVSTGFDDIFLARFDASGAHVWSKKYGNNMQNNVYDMEVAANGDLIIVGDLGSNITFGSTTITAAGGIDGYVVRSDEDGTVLWVRAFQSAGTEAAQSVGILADGSAWVAGYFDTAVNVNGTAGTEISPTGSGQDILLVKYDAAGGYITSRAVNCTGSTLVRDMAVGDDDSVVITGNYDGTLFLSMLAAPAVGGKDAFMFKINPNTGSTVWGRKTGGTGVDEFNGVDIGTCGDIFASGDYFTSSVNFGGGALANLGFNDFVVAKYRQ